MDTLERVGPYEVVRKIGGGGMGEVYEARHTAIGRRVAIKVLRADLAKDVEVNSRFINEARAVNIVDHPGIVQISDYGTLADGTSYIVMEYLHGLTLAAHIVASGGRLPLEDTLRYSRQIASVLAAAHGKGIIHRDLKPDNVMLIPDPDPEEPGRVRVKLLDFGVAKLVHTLTGQSSTAPGTQKSTVMGTPEYMSPEQCRDSGKVTDRTDVYSLGVMLYEMLSGRVPFESESQTEVLAKHMYEAPPSLRRLAQEVPSQLLTIVGQLLEKTPEKRPSMDQVQSLLEAVAVGVIRRSGQRSIPRLPVIVPVGDAADPAASTSPGTASLVGSSETAPLFQRPKWRALMAAVAAFVVIPALGWTLLRGMQPTSVLGSGAGPGQSGATGATGGEANKPAPAQDGTGNRVADDSKKPVLSLVKWTVTSQPPGAQVVRAETDEVLGQTPWHGESSQGSGSEVVRLQLAGFESRLVQLSRAQDVSRHELLTELPETIDKRRAPTVVPGQVATDGKAGNPGPMVGGKDSKGTKKKKRHEEPEVEE